MKRPFSQRPTLELIGPDGQSRLYEVDSETVTIGRDPVGSIEIDDKERHVSWHHARIDRQLGGVFHVVDLQSRNKTSVDGRTLEPFRPRRLADGSRIRIANNKYELIFRLQSVHVAVGTDETTVLGSVDEPGSTRLLTRTGEPIKAFGAVIDVIRSLAGSSGLGEILGRALDALMAAFPAAERGFILTVESDGALITRAVRGLSGDEKLPPLSRTVFTHVIQGGKGLLIADSGIADKPDILDSIASAGILTAICAPLPRHDGRPGGLIQLDRTSSGRGFTAEDLELFAALAIPVGVAVENHSLLKTQSSLAAARKIQEAMLPDRRPSPAGYSFWDHYRPALEVGGDFYDYVPIPPADGEQTSARWSVSLGDVAGKGFPAALLMAATCPEVRHFVRTGASVPEVLSGVNRHLAEHDLDGRFVTLCVAEVDTEKHLLTVAVAGHISPLLRRADGSIVNLADDGAGLPLGIAREAVFGAETVALGPGDVVLIISDGVIDAVDVAGDGFGLDRVRKVLAASPPGAVAVGKALAAAVGTHSAPGVQFDDITIVCFGRDASEGGVSRSPTR